MGQAPSSAPRAVELLRVLEREQYKGSIERVRSFNIGKKTIVLIGERHGEVPEGSTPLFVQFLKGLDCTEPVDVFVEAEYSQKEEYRFRQLSQEEAADDVDAARDSMFSVRRQAQVSKCGDKLRVHAVDVRDNGYQTLVTMTDRYRELTQREVFAYSITLRATELEGVMRMVRSSARKSEHATAIRNFSKHWAGAIERACSQIYDVLSTPAPDDVIADMEDVLWKAHSQLVDIYAFARMLRSDNSDLLIFYGGANHADRLFEGFIVEFPGILVRESLKSSSV